MNRQCQRNKNQIKEKEKEKNTKASNKTYCLKHKASYKNNY